MKRKIALAGLCTLLFLLIFCGCKAEKSDSAPILPTPPALLTQTPEPEAEETADFAALAQAVFAGTEPADTNDFLYSETEDGVCLTAYTGNGGTVIIPDTVGGKAVVALGDRLFYENAALTALSIPASVQKIGHELLTGCRNLTAISLPFLGGSRDAGGVFSYLFTDDTTDGGYILPSTLDTVILTEGTKLSDYAFSSATRLRMIFLPDTMEEVGAFAFANCNQLHCIPLPDTLRTIGEYAFADCTALTEMEIPAGVNSIGFGIFSGCNRLNFLSLPFLGTSREESNHIGYLFGLLSPYWNESGIPDSLYAVTLSGDVPENAFYGCSSIVKVTLQNCTSIGTNAFRDCVLLYEVSLPDSLQKMGDQVFLGCSSLAEVTLPDGLLQMGTGCFMDCTNLQTIKVPASLSSLPASAFSGCLNLSTADLSGLSAVGDYAFYHCVSLQTVIGPKAGAKIGVENDFLLKND